MTFKNLFNKLEFYPFIETDFCIILRKEGCWYAVYNSEGINCFSLYDFKDKGAEELVYEYGVDYFGITDEKEEYAFTASRRKEEVVDFIFNLRAMKDGELEDSSIVTDVFGDVYVYGMADNTLAVLLKDGRGGVRNALLFNEESYQLLLDNRECFWSRREGDTAVIAYDTYALLSYFAEREMDGHTLFLYPLYSGLIPFNETVSTYKFLCGKIEEWVEMFASMIMYVDLKFGENVKFMTFENRCRVEFVVDDTAELLPYLDIVNKSLKKLRGSYLNEGVEIKTFILEKKVIFEKKIISITFTKNIPELETLTDYFIEKYKLPFSVVS